MIGLQVLFHALLSLYIRWAKAFQFALQSFALHVHVYIVARNQPGLTTHDTYILYFILISVLFLLDCNCSVAGTKNATLPGVLYLDCLRDENTAPPRPGMVSTDQQTCVDLKGALSWYFELF